MEGELKIVIIVKGEAGSIGVQSPDSDPVFVLVKGDLPAILASVPEVVTTARDMWAANPRYPKCETPEAVPQTTPGNAQTQNTGAATTPKASPQPNMF